MVIRDITPDGYGFKHTARSRKRGGGLGLLFEKTLSVKITPLKAKSFECMDADVTPRRATFRIIVVYRLHPKHKKNGISNSLFVEECAACKPTNNGRF